MISKYTLRIYKLMVWVTSLFWLSEVKWNKKKGKFIKKGTIRVPFMIGYQILARYIAITYFSLFLFLSENPILSWDFRIGFAWLFQCLVTTPVYIWTANNRSFWGTYCNQTLDVNRNMAKFHGKPVYVKKDGLEALLTAAVVGSLVLAPLAPFLAFLILHYRNPAITRTIIHVSAFVSGTSVTAVNVGAACVLAYHLVYDILLIISSFVWGLTYINSARKWLKLHRWTLAIYEDRHKRQQMRLLFRQMQIVYKLGYEQFFRKPILSITTVAGLMYISFGLFFFIRSLDSSDHTFFVVQGTVTLGFVYGMKTILESMNDITESSKCYMTSLKEEVPKMMKYELRYLNSCHPFKWNLAELLVIDRQIFIWMLTEVILSTLLSLLQAF